MTIQPEKDWYIRNLVLWSQALQILLSLLAPWRKTTGNRWVLGFVSMVFSLSNLVPAFTLVIICSRLSFVDGNIGSYQPPLLVWASFMLLHLAGLGQERKIAFPLCISHHKNEWHQVLVEFVFYEVFVFGFLLFMCWKDKSYLAFINICLAYRATFSKLESLNGFTSHKLNPQNPNFPLTKISQQLICGYGLSFEELNTSRASFFKQPYKDAIRTVHDELNLIYAKFYRWVLISSYEATMLPLLFTFIRLIDIPDKTFPVVLLTFISFFFSPYTSVVLQITVADCCLLVLETVTQLLKIKPGLREADKIINIILMFFTYLGAALLPDLVTSLEQHFSNSWFRSGWCERVPTLNLLVYGLQKPTKFSAASNFLLNKWSMCYRKKYTDELGDLILYELKLTSESLSDFMRFVSDSIRREGSPSDLNKLRNRLASLDKHYWNFNKAVWKMQKGQANADDVKQASGSGSGSGSGSRFASDLFTAAPLPIYVGAAMQMMSAKGQWVLELKGFQDLVNHESPFEKIVLVWHIATGILHCQQSEHNDVSEYRSLSKLSSDYMGYLLIVQPWIMSKSRAYAYEISLQLWSEINALIGISDIRGGEPQEVQVEKICKRIHMLEEESVLRDAHDLAEKLRSKIPDKSEMWKVIGKVWVEMLACAAIHADPSDHIRSLSQGGELATVVWLWMAYLGLINNFYGEASTDESTVYHSSMTGKTPTYKGRKI